MDCHRVSSGNLNAPTDVGATISPGSLFQYGTTQTLNACCRRRALHRCWWILKVWPRSPIRVGAAKTASHGKSGRILVLKIYVSIELESIQRHSFTNVDLINLSLLFFMHLITVCVHNFSLLYRTPLFPTPWAAIVIVTQSLNVAYWSKFFCGLTNITRFCFFSGFPEGVLRLRSNAVATLKLGYNRR